MRNLTQYDFSKPIRIVRLKANGLDIMFYTAVSSALVALIFVILCMKGGKFGLYFDLWRVLVSIPQILITLVPLQLLRELRLWVPKLARQREWTLPELMRLTGQGERETCRLVSRILESGFVVDPSCIKQVDQ